MCVNFYVANNILRSLKNRDFKEENVAVSLGVIYAIYYASMYYPHMLHCISCFSHTQHGRITSNIWSSAASENN